MINSRAHSVSAAIKYVSLLKIAATAVMLTSGTGLAMAQSIWTGGGTDNNWSTSANWSSVPTSGASTQIQFGGTTQLNSYADSDFTLQSLVFNSSAGAFVLSGGQLSINGTGADANGIENQSASTITINNSLKLLAASQIRATGGDLIIGGTVDLNGVSAINFKANTGKTLKMDGIISGNASSISFNSGGTIQLNANNTYTTGAISIFSATVEVGVDATTTSGAFGSGSQVINLGATSAATTPTLLISGSHTIARTIAIATPSSGATSATIGGSTADVSNFTSAIYLSTANTAAQALTLTAASGGRVNISGNISRQTTSTGSADIITKTGLGIVALSGTANNWSGATNVQQGVLLVNGTITSGGAAVTVSSGATLGGFGTINRTVNILDGGVFSAGDMNTASISQAGTLTIGGSLTFANTSILKFDLGALSDSVSVSGNLTLAGILSVTAGGGFGSGTYTLLSYSGTFLNNGLTLDSLPAGYTYALDTSVAGQVNLIVSAIPEPASIAAILGGCGLLAALVRRRPMTIPRG